MYMYIFNFMNCEDGSIHCYSSRDRFILLSDKANHYVVNGKVCVVDNNHKRVDKIQLYDNVDVDFSASDVAIVEVCSEEAVNSSLFINPRSVNCKLVVCGEYAHLLSDEFKKICDEISITGAEPNEES